MTNRTLRPRSHRRRTWRDDEITYLIENHHDLTIKELSQHLRFDRYSVSAKLRRLHLKAKPSPMSIPHQQFPWSTNQLTWLRDNYATAKWPLILTVLPHTKVAIQHKAKHLNIKKATSTNWHAWTPEEDRYMIMHLHIPCNELAKYVNHSVDSIRHHRAELRKRQTKARD